MSKSGIVLIALCVFAGVVTLAPFLGAPSAGQPPAGTGNVGKYQVSVSTVQAPGSGLHGRAILCDTETGQLWESAIPNPGSPKWVWAEMPSPIKQNKKE
jgi:hypothetical protein